MGNVHSNHTAREQLEVSVEDREIYVNMGPSMCSKNPGHENFIGALDLDLWHLPEELRHPMVMKWLQLEMGRTVKVSVKKTSDARPPSDVFYPHVGTATCRTATGRAWLHGQTDEVVSCPTPNCAYNEKLGKGHTALGYLHISTNKHVVFDQFEAANTEVEFYYDAEDCRERVITAYGVDVTYDIENEDQSFISCVFHEADLPDALRTEEIWAVLGQIPKSVRQRMKRHAFVISHPHGTSKKITVGDVLIRYRPWESRNVVSRGVEAAFRYVTGRNAGCVTRYTAGTCPGSSGAPVLVCVDGRFCWPITHSSFETVLGLNSSYTYFR